MKKSKSLDKLEERSNKSLLSIGLDSNFDKLPAKFKAQSNPQFTFNKWIIDQTHQYALAYKPNLAFYEARGSKGWRDLELTMQYLHEQHPEIYTIADAKRADIGSTSEAYAQAIFGHLGFDAITLHPYLGKEALEPFLAYKNKGCIILCRTSNPGAGELQDLEIGSKPLWHQVAQQVSSGWNKNGNCMLVVGATYPEEMAAIRGITGPKLWYLVPGIGAQGGNLEAVMKAGGARIIINSARGIIFAEKPGLTAKKLHQKIHEVHSRLPLNSYKTPGALSHLLD